MLEYMTTLATRFKNDEQGIALTEYLILLGLLTAGVIVAVLAIGGDLGTYWASWASWFGSHDLGGPSQ